MKLRLGLGKHRDLLLPAVAYFICFCLAIPAHSLVTTDVLPQGVRAAAIVWGSSKTVTGQFGPDGDINSLVAPLNLSLSLQDLGQFKGDAKDLASVLNSLSPEQLGEKLLLADLFSQAAVAEQHTVFGMLYGVTDKWSIGGQIPLVHRAAQFSFNAQMVDNSQAYANLIGDIPQLQAALQTLKQASLGTSTFANAIFTDNGYQIPAAQNFYSLGDIEFESRYRYYSLPRSDFTLRVNLRIPTGSWSHTVDYTNLLDRTIGDGCYSVRVGSVQSYKIIPGRLTLLGGFFGTVYAPSSRTMGVPLNAQESLPNLNDPAEVAQVTMVHSPQFNSDISLMLDF